jgi:hypothetical protein
MRALGVELKEKRSQDAAVGGFEGRRHERESRSLGDDAQWQSELSVDGVDNGARGDYVPRAGEIE